MLISMGLHISNKLRTIPRLNLDLFTLSYHGNRQYVVFFFFWCDYRTVCLFFIYRELVLGCYQRMLSLVEQRHLCSDVAFVAALAMSQRGARMKTILRENH